MEVRLALVLIALGFSVREFMTYPHEYGHVYIKPCGKDETGYIWAAPAGSSFAPAKVPYRHILKIKAGTGTLRLNKVDREYKAGDVIIIAAGDTYGFILMDTDTVVHRGHSYLPWC